MLFQVKSYFCVCARIHPYIFYTFCNYIPEDPNIPEELSAPRASCFFNPKPRSKWHVNRMPTLNRPLRRRPIDFSSLTPRRGCRIASYSLISFWSMNIEQGASLMTFQKSISLNNKIVEDSDMFAWGVRLK